MSACQWLYQIDPGQEATWGTEAVALATVARAGVPVLPAFVVSREVSYAYFLQPDVRQRIIKICKELTVKKPEHFTGAARDIRELILKTPLQPAARQALGAYLEELEDQLLLVKGKGLPLTLIAQGEGRVAHHGTPKSLKEADTLLRQLFALQFTPHALYQRFLHEQSIVPAPPAVLVQYAPEGELSGTALQYDAENHDGTVITVEVAHHEHPGLAQHSASDRYRLDSKTLHLLSQTESRHTWAAKKRGAHVSPKHTHKHQRLAERELRQLGRFTRRAQQEFPELQRLHWQLYQNSVTVTGIEPYGAEGGATSTAKQDGRLPLLTGHPVHPGSARGTVRIIHDRDDWASLQDGDIVVLEQLAEKDITRLAGVAGIIAESGHHVSVEGAAAHQLGVPAIAGAASARHQLRSGQTVTLDGTHGAVYAGRLSASELGPHPLSDLPVTGTKIWAALEDATLATPELLQESDGVGMLRGEFILRLLGVHPHEVLHQGMAAEYVELLTEGVERALKAAGNRPVLYQLHDVSEHAFHGWKSWRREKHEPNQLLGNRGTHRLLSEPEILKLECKALASLVHRGYGNIAILLPMVRSVEEAKSMRKLLVQHAPAGLAKRLWLRVETPALTIKAEALADLDPAGVMFDAPALATLITGLDHSNHQVGHHRDQADEAVLDALSYAVSVCRKAGITTAVLAEHEELRPELVETVIKAGVTAFCVRPEDTGWLHGLVASVEQRMLLDHLVGEG